MKADLTFEDAELELEFNKLQAKRSRCLGKQFHLNRAGIWGVVMVRVLISQEWLVAAAVAVVLALPAVSHSLSPQQHLRWRNPIKIFDNLLQIALGCYTHHLIYPNPKVGDPSTFQMAAVLLTGNGVPWQLFNSMWGSLLFRVALPQQAALTVILLLFNRTLCQRNVALRRAYQAIKAATSWPASLSWPFLALQRSTEAWLSAEATRGCGAAVLAAPRAAREAVRAACMQQMSGEGQPGNMSVVSRSAPLGDDGTELCVSWQPISQLALGFLLPTYCIWCSELRQRRAFLEQRAAANNGSTSHSNGGHRHLREVLPTLVEYCMFAVPAVLCMWSMVAVHA